MVIFPFYAIMFSERSGLTTPQISALFAWWILVALVSELPTGTLADKFSRRAVIVWSEVLQAAAFFVWIIAPLFFGYAVGFFLWGISYALNSGAFQAYVYDELNGIGKSSHFTRIYSRSQSMTFVGMLVAYGVASILGQNYVVALWLSILLSLVSAALAFSLPKEKRRQKVATKQLVLLKTAVKEVMSSKILRRLVVSLVVASSFAASMEEYVPLYYKLVGVPNRVIPLTLALGLGLSAVFAWIAHRFEKRANLFSLIALCIAGLTLLATSFTGTVVAVAGMMIFMRMVKVASLLYQSSLQHNITEKTRATVGSLPSFLEELLSIVIVVIFGLIAKLYSTYASIRFVAVMCFVMSVILMLYWRKHRLVPPAQNDNEIEVTDTFNPGVTA